MKTLDQFDIRGRSAIVTGAASGIGLAYAEAMVEAGVRVTLTDIDGEGAEREAARLRGEGGEARAARLDVADRAAFKPVFDDHVAAFGGLDIAFANAGVDPGPGFWNPAGHRNPDGQIDTFDPERWDRSIAINLTGVYNTIREAARVMKAAGKARLDHRHLVQRRPGQRGDRRHALHAGQGRRRPHGPPHRHGARRISHPGERDRARARSSPISAAAGSGTRWCARPGTSRSRSAASPRRTRSSRWRSTWPRTRRAT